MYRIDYEKITSAIKDANAKRVMIQLPDGLKHKALEMQTELQSTQAEILFWAGTNYGACDLPVGADKLGVDLLIHLGHTAWLY
ncbi:diphthamide synthesis protein [Candidatus Woesearchaeota archaeon]|nr:diphthamide synthesis protein [Candidatus Woesearchaeota archaeon]